MKLKFEYTEKHAVDAGYESCHPSPQTLPH